MVVRVCVSPANQTTYNVSFVVNDSIHIFMCVFTKSRFLSVICSCFLYIIHIYILATISIHLSASHRVQHSVILQLSVLVDVPEQKACEVEGTVLIVITVRVRHPGLQSIKKRKQSD